VSTATLGTKEAQSKDLLGRVFEYFLGEFALAEGKKGGQFYTPASVVKLLVEMLEPYEGRVFDPCCGSGGMFVQSEKFIKHHQDHYKKNNGKKLSLNPADYISIYGQESNQTTWRLAKMNLSIRGIDSSNVKWNNEGSFLNDAHKDLKADYIIANPPFNDSDWSGELLQKDARWIYGVPPAGNANYAWIQHFLYHTATNGQEGFVLAKGSLTTKTSNEGEIRKAIIENDLIDCIVNLPSKLFLNTQIPACLWFLKRNKQKRKREILFIDARNLGFLKTRKNLEFTVEDIAKVASTYHNWRTSDSLYEDVQGFCKSVNIEEVKALNYVVTPGRFVGLPDDEDDFNFEERFTSLKSELEKQIAEEYDLNERIKNNLSKINFKVEADV
jgi:type I restriction enzyme M protein